MKSNIDHGLTRSEFVVALISTGYTPELAEKIAAIVQKSINSDKEA